MYKYTSDRRKDVLLPFTLQAKGIKQVSHLNEVQQVKDGY